MIIECLICKKKIREDLTTESACPNFHKKLVDVYGYYEKGVFYLSEAGKQKLAESNKQVVYYTNALREVYQKEYTGTPGRQQEKGKGARGKR